MSPIAAPATADERVALQRRTLATLRLAQVPGQAAVAGMVAVVSLLASEMLGSDRLAGAGSAAFTVGIACTAIPLAAHMRRHGRRPGLAGALLVGALGSGIAAFGGQVGLFPVFVIGMLAFGAGHAATLQQRYVAADLAEPARAGSAIAAIVWVGTLGAALGPMLTPLEKATASAVGLDELIGPYPFASGFFLLAAGAIWVRLRPDPLDVLGVGTVAAVVAGYVPILMFVGLFLLGLGWNIGLIGGSTLLTASVPERSRVEVQGTADLAMSLCGAVAALGSGFVKDSLGFHQLVNLATGLAAVLLVLAWFTAPRKPVR